MGSYVSLWVLVLMVLMGLYGHYGSLWVLMCPFKFLWVFMGPGLYGSLWFFWSM